MSLRVGLIGYGYAGRTFHAPLIRATSGLALVAVASRDPERVHADLGADVAVSDAASLVARDDLDLVVVATPNDTHHPLAKAALRAGRHVVVDKPFALDAAEADDLAHTAEACGRLLSVFHNRRWDADFLTLRALLAAGTLGRPVALWSHFDRFRPQVRARWREGAGPGAGLWLDLGPHMVDQALQLFGMPVAITVDLVRQRDGALADDGFTALLRWPGDATTQSGGVPARGLRVHLSASMLAAQPGPRFVLHGTSGTWRVEGLDAQEESLKAGATPAQIAAAGWGADHRLARLEREDGAALRGESLPLQAGAYPAYYAAVRDALLGAGPNPVPVAQALAVQRVLDAGIVGARERREVRFDA